MFGRPNSSAKGAKNKPGGPPARSDHTMNSYIADNLEVFFKRNINMS